MPEQEKRDGKATGYWYGVWDQRHRGGQRIRVRFDRKADAVGWEAYVKATGEVPPWTTSTGTGHTFAAVAQDCKDKHPPWQRGRSHSTMQMVDWLCASKLGKLPIESITREHLQEVVDECQRRKRSGSTINAYLSTASAVLRFAAEDPKKYGKVVLPVVPYQDKGAPREEVLTFEQEDAVVRVLQERYGPTPALCVRVLAATGMRRGELYGLKPEQVQNDHIRLKAADTKTNAARWVSIEPEMARDLRAMVAAQALPDTSYLLSIFKEACAACGYSEELCLHSLRHTRATRLLEAGVHPTIVMQMMGWTSVETMKRYQHVNIDMQREAANKVSQRRGETLQNSTVVPFTPVAKTGT